MNGCDILDKNQKMNKQRHSVFDNISEKVFSLLKNGMFGYFFTSYDEANEKYLCNAKRKRKSANSGKTRRKVSRLIENSFFVNAIPKLVDRLLRVTLRDYGVMLFLMGALISVLYPLNDYILFLNVTLDMFISGIAVCVCSIPMLFSSKSLALNIYNSKLCNRVLYGFLGLNKEKLRVVAEKPKISLINLAFFIGIGLGVISYFVFSLRLLAIIGVLILSYCVLRTPEVGIIAIILALPFISVLALQLCSAYVFICYTIKCIIGKRTFKFEYFDLWIVITLVVLFVRGSISDSPLASIKDSLSSVALMLSYFVVTNLIRTKEWFKRCLISLVSTGIMASALAIIQLIIGKVSLYVPELSKLFTYGQSVTSSFVSAEVFAHFLIAIIPFTIVHFISERSGAKKLIGLILGTVLIVTLGFTHSLSGFVGLIFATLLLLIIFNRNFAYLALITVAACPVLYFTLPQYALEQLLSIKMLDGITLSSFIVKTREGFQMFMSHIFGIGSGESVYNATFGSGDGYFDNIFIQSLIEYGIVGFIALILFGIMLIRLTFSYCVKAKNQYRKINCCAGFCSVSGLLAAGLITYTWYDKHICLLFWLLVALSFAYIRIEKQEEDSKGVFKDFTYATLEIALTDDIYHDTIPKRRYVHVPKTEIDLAGEHEIKEFEDTDDSLNAVKEIEEAENQENGETK